MKQLKKTLLTLVALLAVTTGAWAEEKMVTINYSTLSSGAVTATGFKTILENFIYVGPDPATITTSEGVITKLVIKKSSVYANNFTEDNVGVTPGTITYGSDEITVTDINAESVTLSRKGSKNWSPSSVDVYYAGASSEPSAQTVDVTPVTGQTNQWTLNMPAGNVELQVEYDPWKVTLQTNNDQWGTVEAVTGGGVKEFTVPETWGSDNTTFSAADLPSDFAEVTDEVAEAIPAPSSEGNVMLFYGFNGTKAKAIVYSLGTIYRQGEQEITRHTIYSSANSYGYKICYTTAGDVTANADGTYSVVAGKSITLKATPADGYRLAGWYKVDGNDVAALTEADGAVADAEAGTLTLTPEADVTIRAEFAEQTYAVTFADDTAEPDKWTADPNTDVKKGQTVTVNYSGSKKVIGVKAEKKFSTPSLSLTSPEVGQVIGSDGKNYAAANVPSGVDKVAMIAYVSGSNGLAIALADEGLLNWATAKSTCEAKTPAFSNGTWKLPSQDEWKQMFIANGGNEDSYDGLNTAIITAGGTAFQDGSVTYWSSSEYDSDQAHLAQFYYGYPLWYKDWKVNEDYVRACLAF